MKIITVTMSPAYDVHCFCKRLDTGRENTVAMTSYDAGGKGVNLSRALAEMGKESIAVVVLGEDNSGAFLSSMTQSNIDYRPINVPGRIRENITVHTEGGVETRISLRAEPYREGVIEAVEEIICGADDGNTVAVFGGKLPEGARERGFNRMLRNLGERGIRVVVDSGSLTLSDIKEIKPYLIKPNIEELEALSGNSFRNSEDMRKFARSICDLGAECVIVSMGEGGAALFGALGEFFAVAPKINPVSTVGAGDTMLAGFLYAQSLGLSAEQRLKYSVAAGSAACLTQGTKSPSAAQIEKILEKMQ